ncbi:hypothetical protein MVEN_01791200 [Mycena venus]|uniref:Uncharacterized protein n=1 Tax=Mycena venus TaxID=2733690 RepID=A0A8H7CLE8_9AGAR|nr:hypothetical protein MVEN_01791200 [Mycena venus]
MNATSLPQELIDMVIRGSAADVPTLRSCSLVCRAFVPSSQACIFSVVALIPGLPTSCPRRLHDILVDSPHLGGHVRTLSVIEGIGAGRWLTDPNTSSAVLGILQHLKGVESFSFSGRPWRDLPKELRAGVCNFCKRSHLVSLSLMSLGRFDDLREFSQLVASPTLTRLTMQLVVLPAPDEGENTLTNPPKLRTCTCYLGHPTLAVITKWLVDGDVLPNLHTLSIMWNRDSDSQLQTMVNSLSSLHQLNLSVESSNSYFLFTLSLANLKRIQGVNITIATFTSLHTGVSVLIARIIESCPQTLIDFEVKINLYGRSLLEIDWEPLRNVVTVEIFPALLNFQVEAAPATDEGKENAHCLVKNIQSTFGDLHKQGILKCGMVPLVINPFAWT